jgi:Xaa-Pro aminopeptidase
MSISIREYRARRARVLKELKGAAAVVLAGEGSAPLRGRWRADRNFYWLTGIDTEPGAAVLFDSAAPNPDHQVVLFLRPVNPEVDRWDGYRDEITPTLRERYGFSAIFRSASLPAFLTGAARRGKRLACLHPFSVYPAPVSADLALFRQVAERVPGTSIEDRTQLLIAQRAVKSAGELALMRQAAAATAEGYRAVFQMLKPGVNESAIQAALENAYRATGGDRETPYNSIVGSGLNGTVLHYMENQAEARAGELVVIDSAAAAEGYAADVTRTLPVSGTFTAEQRKLYEIVLAAEEAAIRKVRPGVTMREVDAAAREVITAAGYGHTFIHSVGHPLGLDVHEAPPDGPLRAGMVVTIEPGIYLPDAKTGIRIEDDILVTRRGPVNLTAAIPKTVRALEAALRR